MDAFQKAELIAADTIVWAGPGLESDLAQTLVRMPALAGKSMPLANDIPLFVRDGYKGPAEDRQASRAFGFWTDPRLAAMAVRHLTPHLVRMDPDRQGLYLDNELALLARLRALETEIDSALGPGLALPASTLARVDPYFRHRFLDTATESAAADDHRRKVSTADPDDCAGAALPAGTGAPGPDYYFETMRRQAQALAACRDLSRPNGI
jgi:zinc transport system substrate-binding protein